MLPTFILSVYLRPILYSKLGNEMRMLNNQYILENTTIPQLSFSEILKHSRDSFDTSRKSLLEIQPEVIEIDSGVFFKHTSLIQFPRVSVIQSNNSILTFCSCDAPKTKLCEH